MESSSADTPTEPRAVSIEVLGQRFSVVSDADEARVREVAALLSQRIETVRERFRRTQPDRVALMAALNLAEELLEERSRGEQLRRKVRERSVRLLASIDAVSRDLDARIAAPLASPIAPESEEGEASAPHDGSTTPLPGS